MSTAPTGARNLSRRHHVPTVYRLRHETCCLVASGIALASGAAYAGAPNGSPINDISFFAESPTVLIDFEFRGDGSPMDLLDGGSLTMPAAEYADYDPNDLFAFPTGVTFSPQVKWVDDGNHFGGILDAFASPENGISSANIDQFEIAFTSPVTSFGFWVADNATPGTDTQPIFTIKDTQGQVIEVLDFNTNSGNLFHDGSFPGPNSTVINYGFMGYQINPNSSLAIGSVEIEKGEAIFDDLTFVPIPTPSTFALIGLSGIYTLRRKR